MKERELDRRTFLQLTAMGGFGLALPFSISAQKTSAAFAKTARAFPLESVRLTPSPFFDAVTANLAYLKKIEADRLLHNFRVHAKLEPKGAVYGGWESDTIAGHTLGHYLTACSLIHAQTGDEEVKKRVDYIVGELAECQNAAGGGYVAGFTRKKGKEVENGRGLGRFRHSAGAESEGIDRSIGIDRMRFPQGSQGQGS